MFLKRSEAVSYTHLAKDYVECMWLILQHDTPEDFVIATGEYHLSLIHIYADKAVVVNITSEEDVLRVAREERIDGVIHPCSEVSMNVDVYKRQLLYF